MGPACVLINRLVKQTMPRTPKLGSRGKPEETRREILEAAIQEFASEGVAGARTDSIAKAAGVNKALLYYYFADKEALYGAVLDSVFSGLLAEAQKVFNSGGSAGEKILQYSLTHFHYIAAHPEYPRLVQHEMMRAQGGHSLHIERIVVTFFRPILSGLIQMLAAGMKTGEFREIDPMQFGVSMTGLNVFYFVSVPIQRAIGNRDPFTRESQQERCAAVLDMLGSTLFADAHRGRTLAKAVLSAWKPATLPKIPRKVTRT